MDARLREMIRCWVALALPPSVKGFSVMYAVSAAGRELEEANPEATKQIALHYGTFLAFLQSFGTFFTITEDGKSLRLTTSIRFVRCMFYSAVMRYTESDVLSETSPSIQEIELVVFGGSKRMQDRFFKVFGSIQGFISYFWDAESVYQLFKDELRTSYTVRTQRALLALNKTNQSSALRVVGEWMRANYDGEELEEWWMAANQVFREEEMLSIAEQSSANRLKEAHENVDFANAVLALMQAFGNEREAEVELFWTQEPNSSFRFLRNEKLVEELRECRGGRKADEIMAELRDKYLSHNLARLIDSDPRNWNMFLNQSEKSTLVQVRWNCPICGEEYRSDVLQCAKCTDSTKNQEIDCGENEEMTFRDLI